MKKRFKLRNSISCNIPQSSVGWFWKEIGSNTYSFSSDPCSNETTAFCLQFQINLKELTELSIKSVILWTAASMAEMLELNALSGNSSVVSQTQANTSWQQHDIHEAFMQHLSRAVPHLEVPLKSTSPSVAQVDSLLKQQPCFLLIYLDGHHPRRTKREVFRSCKEAQGGCCKEKLYVNFREIGWSNWIIWPKGFSTYHCKGVCRGQWQILKHSTWSCDPNKCWLLLINIAIPKVHTPTTVQVPQLRPFSKYLVLREI